jgi:hypothetical protein
VTYLRLVVELTGFCWLSLLVVCIILPNGLRSLLVVSFYFVLAGYFLAVLILPAKVTVYLNLTVLPRVFGLNLMLFKNSKRFPEF